VCVSFAYSSFLCDCSLSSHFAHLPSVRIVVSFRSPPLCTCCLSLCCSEHQTRHLFNFPEAPPFPLPLQNNVLFIYIPVSLTLWQTSGAPVLGGAPSPLFVVCPVVPVQRPEDTFIGRVTSRYTGYKIYLKRGECLREVVKRKFATLVVY
jgi:hypothetical protein